MRRVYKLIFSFLSVTFAPCMALSEEIADFSKLTQYHVQKIEHPESIEDIVAIVKSHPRHVSIKGGGFSMGGQISAVDGVVIDMDRVNAIKEINLGSKPTITVEAGARWRDIQVAIDPFDMSVKIMQSYNDFSVGGSLSVNVHGRYAGYGPIISSVRQIKIVTANGDVVRASREEHPQLFSAAIGGYGAVGVIVEATLDLADNIKVRRIHERIQDNDTKRVVERYLQYFQSTTQGRGQDEEAILTNADLYPPDCKTLDSVTWVATTDALTETARMQDPAYASTITKKSMMSFAELFGFAKYLREHYLSPSEFQYNRVVWRNFEASYTVDELRALNALLPEKYLVADFSNRSALLQEYFIPLAAVANFVPTMCSIFRKHNVNVMNISFRHFPRDTESILSWSQQEGFALVIYYIQEAGTNKVAKLAAAKNWTQEMIDEILKSGGTYYLPYQVYGSVAQIARAYPRLCEFLSVKNKFDPKGMFTNTLWDTYGSKLSC